MNIVVSAYYIACYSVNLVNLALLAILYLRKREASYGHELMFMLGLMTISTSLSLPCMLSDPVSGGLPPFMAALFYQLLIGGICLVAGTAPAYVHSLLPSRVGRAMSGFTRITAFVLVIAAVTETILTGRSALMPFCFYYMVASSLWAVGWFLYHVIKDRSLLRTCDSARIIVIMGVLTIFFMPLIVAFDYMGTSLKFLNLSGGERLVVVPLFLAIWSVLLLKKNIRSLGIQASLSTNESTRPALDSFNLSEREKEVLGQLVSGLSYEAIADKLFISHSTVKTHISRIYRKTGVSNKIELISRLKAEDHPKS